MDPEFLENFGKMLDILEWTGFGLVCFVCFVCMSLPKNMFLYWISGIAISKSKERCSTKKKNGFATHIE